MKGFISGLPKVELHLHIEGTLEPEMMFSLAQKNAVPLPFASVEALQAAYQYNDLLDFIHLYSEGARVLCTEQDFYDLTWAYLHRCKQEHVLHTEIFFDPQMHIQNGVAFSTVINGIDRALLNGREQLGISSCLILCFLRHLNEDDAIATFELALPYKDKIIAVGLDGVERGNPPDKFARVFKMARDAGFKTVAHAGEEGLVDNIRTAIEQLKVNRIDHGVKCTGEPALIETLRQTQIPLTLCPLSNIKLQVFERIDDHNIVQLLDEGLCITINSDDPAYFGGYMNANFMAVAETFNLSKSTMARFTKMAIQASFLSGDEKAALQARLNHYLDLQFKPVI
ncbi:adenosine deaminase [Photobacterium nomapromontoriensis]|uniref:adenosine deaminase n=1 Tax=Photobacterium nomapromontoriensis TaxID=2910237 RepID=UPI003D13666F